MIAITLAARLGLAKYYSSPQRRSLLSVILGLLIALPTGGLLASPPLNLQDAAQQDSAAQQDEGEGEDEDERGFVSLFDGKTLAGWTGDSEWFRCHQGAIVAGALDKQIPHNFFLCTTAEYGDFELRLEARLVGKGDNAGVQFRTAKIPGSHEVSGYQADMGSAWDRPVWGALYDESRRNKMLAEPQAELVRQVLKPADWNALTIRCQGPRVQIWLNGTQTVDYIEPDAKIARRGVIAVQIHGGPAAEASYRKIRIQELSEDR
ncbi:3-keto-disaccharide hydrolase [Planctomycetaceae bacterium SH139]